MSVQERKRARISAALAGSASSRNDRVSSEKTTPKPKVSSGRLRSWISTSTSGKACRARIPK